MYINKGINQNFKIFRVFNLGFIVFLWTLINCLDKMVVGDDVTLIDAGTATAMAVKEFLEENNLSADKDNLPKHKFFASDKSHSFCNTATRLLGKKLSDEDIKQVDLGGL